MKAIFNLAILALGLLHSPISRAQQTPSRPTSLADTTLAQNYFDQGNKLEARAQYDSSIFCFEKARGIYEKILARYDEPKIWGKYVSCYNDIGWNLMNKGEYENAMSYFNKALAIGADKLAQPHSQTANSYNSIAVVYRLKGDYDRSLEYLTKALAIKRQLFGENHNAVASTCNNLAIVYLEKGDYNQALAYQNQALNVKRQVRGENHPEVGMSYNNIGNIYEKKGDYDQALNYHTKALEILRRAYGDHHSSVAASYNNIGNIHEKKGDYDQALEYHNHALSIRRQALGENHPWLGDSYFNIGVVYEAKNDYEQAISNHTKSLNLRQKAFGEKHDAIARSYSNLGNIHNRKGDYAQALIFLSQALAINLALLGERHPNLVLNYVQLGLTSAGQGNQAEAMAYLKKALDRALQIHGDKHPEVGFVYLELGELYRKQHNLTKALNYYQKSIIALVPDFYDTSAYANPTLQNFRPQRDLLEALRSKAETLRRLYWEKTPAPQDLETALSTYGVAAELVDKTRWIYKAEGSKLFLAQIAYPTYSKALQTALELYTLTHEASYQHQAFSFAEKGKVAVLNEALQEIRARQFTGLPDSLLEKERNLRIDLAFYETEIQKEKEKKDGRDSLKVGDFENRYFRRKYQYEQLVESLERDHPRYYELKYRPQSTEMAALQKALAPNSALLEYFVGDSAIYIFAVSPNAFDVKAVAKDTSFDRLVTDFLRSIKKLEKAEFVKTSHSLYETLITPIRTQIIAARKLIIIPDGALSYVPFEALIAGNAPKVSHAEIDFTRLDYLIRRYEISYHYSATLYQKAVADQASVASRQRDGSFLGFAPVFSDSVKNGYILASAADSSALAPLYTSLRSVMVGGKRFSELKYSEEELAGIIKLFEKKSKAGIGYFHRQASEENFKQALGNHNFVHLATHGILEEDNPRLSGLIFSQPADSGRVEDGILYAGEMFNLATNADLVVLSSCESGLGKLVKGEGLMALTRGFIYAGAPNVIVSLWKVYDKHTSALMVELYKNILSGKSYATALRDAKLQMLRKPLTAFPQKWSAFVLVGR